MSDGDAFGARRGFAPRLVLPRVAVNVGSGVEVAFSGGDTGLAAMNVSEFADEEFSLLGGIEVGRVCEIVARIIISTSFTSYSDKSCGFAVVTSLTNS